MQCCCCLWSTNAMGTWESSIGTYGHVCKMLQDLGRCRCNYNTSQLFHIGFKPDPVSSMYCLQNLEHSRHNSTVVTGMPLEKLTDTWTRSFEAESGNMSSLLALLVVGTTGLFWSAQTQTCEIFGSFKLSESNYSTHSENTRFATLWHHFFV